MTDPASLEWLVAAARTAPSLEAFVDDVVAHLCAAMGADTIALSVDPGAGGGLYRFGCGDQADADLIADGADLSKLERAPEGAFLHHFRLRVASGALLAKPKPDPTAVACLQPALELLDLRCELWRAVEDASRDPLTGLLNRRATMLALGRAIAEGNRHADRDFAVAMLDLDHFKWFNDTYGHGVGDDLLIELGRVLAVTVRASDVASRWGGDEFLLIFPASGPDMVETVLGRVRTKLEGFLSRYLREAPHGGFSAGIAAFPADGRDANTLIRVADERLYEQKAKLPPSPA